MVVPAPMMGPTEVAGFKPAANWNGAVGAAGTLASLKLADAISTSAQVTWTAPFVVGSGIWTAGFPDAAGDTRMMNGYLDPSSTTMPGTVTVSGLPGVIAASSYDVYVYVFGDIPFTATRTYNYAIGAASVTVSQSGPTPNAFSGYKLVAPSGGTGNTVIFKNVAGTSFTLTATPGSGTQMRAPINGIQIVSPAGS